MKIHLWPDYIIRKSMFLSACQLSSGLIRCVWAQERPDQFLFLRRYISAAQTSALIILSAGLFGALLLEDMLRTSRP